MDETVGSIEFVPSRTFDWMIKDFMEWADGADKSIWDLFQYSPEIHLQGCTFKLAISSFLVSDLVNINCLTPHDYQIELDMFSLHLVDNDGKKKKICLMKECSLSEAGALVSRTDIEQHLHNGQLRIRCHLDIKSITKISPKEEALVRDSSLVADLCKENDNLRFCDFTLECDGRELPVVRHLLAARSPVFGAMFENKGFKEAETGRAVIEDISPETIDAIIKYAHTSIVEDKDLTTELLAAADKYQITSLFDKCETHLCKNLTCANAAEFYIVAYLHQADKLKVCAKRFICNRFPQILKSEAEGMMFMAKHHTEPFFELLDFYSN